MNPNPSLVDIGHGVSMEVRRLDGDVIGVYYEHPCMDGKPAPGWAPVKPHRSDGWDLVKLEPLTLSPSLLCRTCGHHGFIERGVWRPA